MSSAGVDRLLRLGGAAALAGLLALPWYALGVPIHAPFPVAAPATITGWKALTTVRWLAVVTIGMTIIGEPIIGVSARLTRVVAAATALVLAYRVLISVPDSAKVEAPLVCAYLAIVAAAAVAIGSRPPGLPRAGDRAEGPRDGSRGTTPPRSGGLPARDTRPDARPRGEPSAWSPET
jgi:hypothetical protein